jgi:hypothetical protein
MSSDNIKRWELIKEASKVAAFHKASFEIDPTVQKALIGGGIGAGLGGASALLGEDDEEESRGSKAMRRALIGGGLGAAAGGAYGLATGTPAAAAEPKKEPAAKIPTPAEKPGPSNDPNSPSYVPGGPGSAAGPDAPPPPAADIPGVTSPGIDYEQQGVDEAEAAGILNTPDQPAGQVGGSLDESGAADAAPTAPETNFQPAMGMGENGGIYSIEYDADGNASYSLPTMTDPATGEVFENMELRFKDPNSFFSKDGQIVVPDGQGGWRIGGPDDIDWLNDPAQLEAQSRVDATAAQAQNRLGPDANPGPDGVMGTADDGTGQSQNDLARQQEADEISADVAAQAAGRLGPNAKPGPDGVMGTADDGTGESKAEKARRLDAEQRQDATANQAQNRLGPKARPGPDGVMGTADDGTGESVDDSIHDRHPVDEAGQQKARLGPNARPGPDGVMGTADDGQGPTIAEQKIIDKYKDQGQEKKNSWNVTSMPSPEDAINFGAWMAKQALGRAPKPPKGGFDSRLAPSARPGPDGVMGTKDDGIGRPISEFRKDSAKKKKKSKKRRRVLVGPKGQARSLSPKTEEDDEKKAALRLRSIVERGTANFFNAR